MFLFSIVVVVVRVNIAMLGNANLLCFAGVVVLTHKPNILLQFQSFSGTTHRSTRMNPNQSYGLSDQSIARFHSYFFISFRVKVEVKSDHGKKK